MKNYADNRGCRPKEKILLKLNNSSEYITQSNLIIVYYFMKLVKIKGSLEAGVYSDLLQQYTHQRHPTTVFVKYSKYLFGKANTA